MRGREVTSRCWRSARISSPIIARAKEPAAFRLELVEPRDAAHQRHLGGLKLLDPYEPNKWKRVLSGNLFAILAPNQGERASRVGKLFCAAVPKMYLCPLAVAFQYRAPTICGVANVLPGFQFHCATSLLTHDQESSYTRNCQSQASTRFGLFSYSSSLYNKDLSHGPSEGIRSRRYKRMLFSWPAR
jgi:hypothetical protein